MADQDIIKTAEKLIQDFFNKMTFSVETNLSLGDDKTLILEANTPEARVLIGERGQTLVEIQQLLNRIIKKQLEEAVYLDLDINRYKANKVKYLMDIAHTAADEVALIGREKVLDPMSAFERRVVHLELSRRPDIQTESMGEEPERRIVIRPISFSERV
ncbi:MAG: hypothetical protein PHN39_00405 [Candidatus Pacebacteria bacterium]|nr:hypothetical protein [Candidatus Paceibacterota bacterium]